MRTEQNKSTCCTPIQTSAKKFKTIAIIIYHNERKMSNV